MNNHSQPWVVGASNRTLETWPERSRGDASWFTFFTRELTGTRGMSAGLMEIPPNGGELRPHRHAQSEIYFVAEGAGALVIDGVTTAIGPGVSAFIPGDAEHSVRNDGPVVLRIFYVFPTDSFAEVIYRFPESGS